MREDFAGFFRKQLTQMVVRQAAVVTTVSGDLTHAMKNHGLHNSDYRVIHNVVDSVFFEVAAKRPLEGKSSRKEFVHVSCFTDAHKNISGLLRVVKKLADSRNDFHFTLVGEGEDLNKMKAYAQTLAIPENMILFTGLLEGKSLPDFWKGKCWHKPWQKLMLSSSLVIMKTCRWSSMKVLCWEFPFFQPMWEVLPKW